MQVGELRHRVTIQRPARSQSASGAAVVSWADVAQRWAAIEPATGREAYLSDQVRATMTHLIRMRGSKSLSLTSHDRFVHAGRVYNPIAVVNVNQRNIELRIAAIEEVGVAP